jgi:hypothetical protein
MYAWIWRRIPFGLRGKLAASTLVVAAITALLWFVVFPVVEPIMPFNNGQLDDTGQVPASAGVSGSGPASGGPDARRSSPAAGGAASPSPSPSPSPTSLSR